MIIVTEKKCNEKYPGGNNSITLKSTYKEPVKIRLYAGEFTLKTEMVSPTESQEVFIKIPSWTEPCTVKMRVFPVVGVETNLQPLRQLFRTQYDGGESSGDFREDIVTV